MKTALLIHGTCDAEEYFSDEYPSLSNSHWFPWLQKQLLIKNIFTQTPEMPDAFKPDYEKWKSEFERYSIDDDTVLVGHSCGGGFLIRWLSENKVKVKKLILVAPWLDPNRSKTDTFFDFAINPSISERMDTHIFISNDDDKDIQVSVSKIKDALPGVKRHDFQGMGHFTYEKMKTDKFPELLNVIVS